jgi:uncharacterized DUF497 family protein
LEPKSFIWDPAKALLNKGKHGVDFEEAASQAGGCKGNP